MQVDTIYEPGQIVSYKEKPALIIRITTNGRGVMLKMPEKMYITVPKEEVKPYKGDKDTALRLLAGERP